MGFGWLRGANNQCRATALSLKPNHLVPPVTSLKTLSWLSGLVKHGPCTQEAPPECVPTSDAPHKQIWKCTSLQEVSNLPKETRARPCLLAGWFKNIFSASGIHSFSPTLLGALQKGASQHCADRNKASNLVNRQIGALAKMNFPKRIRVSHPSMNQGSSQLHRGR